MKKVIRVMLFIVVVGVFLTACNNTTAANLNGDASSNTKVSKIKKITLDDVKNIYNGGENGNIIELTNYKNYALVKYQKENRYYYDWYNLETGDRDILPVWDTHAKLKEIVNENDIFFISDGFHIESNYSGFPYNIECLRKKEIVDSQDDFFEKQIDKYFRIDEITEFGNGPKSKVASLKSSICGIEILFEPINKEDLAFGGITLPHTKISYLQNSNQLILEMPETKAERSILQSMCTDNENPFIKSMEIDTINESIIITLSENVHRFV